jgi:Uma2 family endonuclease
MTSQPQFFYISPQNYLAGEEVSPIKHEYRQGQVYAMSGAKKAHIIIASNLIILLGNHLRDSPCIVLGSDIKVRIEKANCFYYPDVSVTCDKPDLETNEVFILSPLLIVEVLSPSTAAFDKGEKFADYSTLPSLQEYVLISQSHIEVTCFRQKAGQWQQHSVRRGEVLELVSVGLRCPVEALYQKVWGIS